MVGFRVRVDRCGFIGVDVGGAFPLSVGVGSRVGAGIGVDVGGASPLSVGVGSRVGAGTSPGSGGADGATRVSFESGGSVVRLLWRFP